MEENDLMKIDIKNLDNAYTNIIEAMTNLNEVDGLFDEYKQLDLIAQAIDKEKTKLEIELQNLEEEAEYKKNKAMWEIEKREEINEYWKSQF